MKQSLIPRSVAIRAAVILLAVLGSTRVFAQQATALITGAVRDPTGAVVVGAKITLKNSGTNVARNTATDKDGAYLFTLVPIGTYEISVEQQGFNKYVRKGITLEINQNANLEIVLTVGTTTQVVEVTGDVTQVDTISATLGKVETTQRILDLPLVERDTLQLGLLQAGVFAPDQDDGSGNPFAVSGQRSESITFLIDGADNNDFLGNNIVVNPNPDAVDEFKILTNNYGAEYGRTSGGIINQVIKSGTNDWHGSLFEFFRNEALNASDYFLQEVPVFKRNLFGGSIGGPIKKDKTFFFASYQGNRRREGQVAPALTVLSPAERTGDFSELYTGDIDPITGFDVGQLYDPTTGNPFTCSGNPCNQVPVDPVIQTIMSKYLPLPNRPGNQFVSAPVASIRDDQGIVRIDHNFSQKDTLSAVYLIDDTSDSFPFEIVKGASTGGDVPVGSGFTDAFRYQTGSLTWTHIISPTMVNELRFAANRVASLTAVPLDTTSPASLGFITVNPDDAAGTAPPLMAVSGAFALGPSPQGPTKVHDVTFQYQETFSWTHGHHDLKFGGDLRWVRNNFNYDFYNNGSYFFGDFGAFTASPNSDSSSFGSSLADFVGGYFDNYYQFANAVYGIRTHSLYFFGQDSWKVTPRLTLDYGLRYEYNSPQVDPHNEIMGFFPGQQSTVFPTAPPSFLYPGDPGTPNRGMIYPDRNNFAPRFGFAWDMLGTGKLVMRGGYGIFYDIEDGALNLQFGGQPPFGYVANNYPCFGGSGCLNSVNGSFVSDPFQGLYDDPFPFAKQGFAGTFFSPALPYAFVVNPHFRTPYAQNFNFGFQFQATKNMMIEAVYVGSLSRKAILSNEVNYPLLSILKQQLTANGGDPSLLNPECARPLAGCSDPLDPTSIPTGAQQIYTNLSAANSDSHEFQLTVDQRFSHGLTFRAAYTLSKTIDVSSGFRARSATLTDPTNPLFDRGLADFDATHRLVLSPIWEIPWDKPFHGNTFMHKLTEGWSLTAIASFQSGAPFTLYQNNNSSELDNYLDRPDVIAPIQIFHNPRGYGTLSGSCGGGTPGHYYFNPASFDCGNVPLFSHGDMGRNVLRGPGINNWDVSILKNFKFSESKYLQFRAEFFNAFNHVQFYSPTLESGTEGFSDQFGQVTTDRGARIIQFALKLYF